MDDSKSDLLHFDRCEEISWQWHEQNLDTLPIAVIVLDGVSNALPALPRSFWNFSTSNFGRSSTGLRRMVKLHDLESPLPEAIAAGPF